MISRTDEFKTGTCYIGRDEFGIQMDYFLILNRQEEEVLVEGGKISHLGLVEEHSKVIYEIAHNSEFMYSSVPDLFVDAKKLYTRRGLSEKLNEYADMRVVDILKSDKLELLTALYLPVDDKQVDECVLMSFVDKNKRWAYVMNKNTKEVERLKTIDIQHKYYFSYNLARQAAGEELKPCVE